MPVVTAITGFVTAMLSESLDPAALSLAAALFCGYEHQSAVQLVHRTLACLLTLAFAFETSPNALLAAPLTPLLLVPTANFPPWGAVLDDMDTAALPVTAAPTRLLPAVANEAFDSLPIKRGLPAVWAPVAIAAAAFSSPSLTGARDARRGRAIYHDEEHDCSVR